MFVPPPLPIPIISLLVNFGIDIIILAMLVRAIASFFRVDERFAIIRFCARITDPFILPLRRYVPPVGFIDIAFFLAWFMLSTLQLLFLQALPAGW
jgi:YggT family protein